MDDTPSPRPFRERANVLLVAAYLVIAAAAWYLLRELAPVLRPLLLAVFLAYVILPAQALLARRVPGPVAYVALGLATLGVCFLLALMTYHSAVDLAAELPQYTERGKAIVQRVRGTLDQWPRLSGFLGDAATDDRGAARLRDAAAVLANVSAEVLSEGVVVGIYLLFLLLEAAHFPGRVRRGFAPARAERLLAMVGNINAAVATYLKVKVLASLVLALPAVVILGLFGVKFAPLWGVLTFLLNFVPYLGSVVACGLPILLAFLQLDPGWQPIAVTVLLIADHALSAYVFEPALTGKAVGLSPLVIVLALAFWGLCWGLIGMLLAVPLTVVFKIVLEHRPPTRPLARLMGEG